MQIHFNNATLDIPEIYIPVLVIGSGAAGLSCAVHVQRGGGDVIVVTDNINGGTSRNTGSDKQTYYKLSDASPIADSPYEMAKSYLTNGAAHGDLTLVEALGSNQAFYHLVSMGVPFPTNRYGGYTGYKTDHDQAQRGVSLGPFTSREMVRCLREESERLGIPIHDACDVVKLLKVEDRVVGAIVLDKTKLSLPSKGFSVYLADHVVLATGGPAGFYSDSVYPKVHTGAIGLALEIGAQAVNLTESQFGLASVKFRWNLSGSYQQVLPRYYSTAQDGSDEQDFLLPYFGDWEALTSAIFLKGYQWPFDAQKIMNNGSSLIDLLVFNERHVKGRRVFLDYQRNPVGRPDWPEFSFDVVCETAKEYLSNSEAWAATPIERLSKLNPESIKLYFMHHIDIAKEPLEIAVCAQHNNGGLASTIWWESTTVSHLYPIGEVNGSHGVSRPGGSALNAGQVGANRAAQKILHGLRTEEPMAAVAQVSQQVGQFLEEAFSLICEGSSYHPKALKQDIQRRMSEYAGPIRKLESIQVAKGQALSLLKDHAYRKQVPLHLLPMLLKNRHMLIAQYCYISAIEDYLEHDGGSRGSFLVVDPQGIQLHPSLDSYKLKPVNPQLKQVVQYVQYQAPGVAQFHYEACRPIPEDSFWFEKVWAEYRADEQFN